MHDKGESRRADGGRVYDSGERGRVDGERIGARGQPHDEDEPRPVDGERLRNHVSRFIALLRRMGLAVGTGQTIDALRAFASIDLRRRDDVYAALRAVLLDAHSHEPAFAAAFDRFWSGLRPLGEPPNVASDLPAPPVPPDMLPPGEERAGGEQETGSVLRLVGADDELALDQDDAAGEDDAAHGETVAYSATEALRQRDFGELTPAELAEMRRLMTDLSFVTPPRRLRRTEAARGGKLLDPRRVARHNLRYGGEVLVLPRRRHKVRPRPLALICDVSGSMDRYTRLLLRFLHAATQG